MNNKLQTKDLINVGIFTALYFALYFATGMLGYIPIFMLAIPFLCPLVTGIPFMLFLTKVKKFGMITIMAFIMSLVMFATGHSWTILLFGTIFGLLGDLIIMSGRYTSWKHSVIGYIVFSEWIVGALFPLFFMKESYFATIREGYGDTYTDTLMAITPIWVFWVMIILVVIGAFLGGILGRTTLKKHFKRAGIV